MIRQIIFVALILVLFASCGNRNQREIREPVRARTVNQVLEHGRSEFVTNRRNPMSWGHNQTIYVFADRDVWHATEPLLRYSLERDFFTTENETLFDIVHGDIDRINHFFRFRNLIFIGDLNSNQPVSAYINRVMSEQALDSVRQRGASMFMNLNPWANDQLVMFFIGDGTQNLRYFMLENNDAYFQIFKNRFIARAVYQSQRVKGLRDSFFRGLPFIMYIPETYRVFRRDLENNFISFIWRSRNDQTHNPDLYISIYWEYADENPLDDDWLVNKRAEIAWKYHDEDEFDPNAVTRGMMDFNGREAWFVSGAWQNRKHFMGGAFRAFAFWDEELKIVYMIDTSIYFPAGNKLRHLLEMEGIAKTIVPRKVD